MRSSQDTQNHYFELLRGWKALVGVDAYPMNEPRLGIKEKVTVSYFLTLNDSEFDVSLYFLFNVLFALIEPGLRQQKK